MVLDARIKKYKPTLAQETEQQKLVPGGWMEDQIENLRIGEKIRSAMANLPGPDANLTECIEFSRKNDPTQEFRERWGADYPDRARELWRASTHAFKAGRATGYSPDEVLMCMAYDVTVAPYIGVPEEVSYSYLHAMLQELREKH
jgi:hypothetical protein